MSIYKIVPPLLAILFFAISFKANADITEEQRSGEINFGFSYQSGSYSSQRYKLNANITNPIESGEITGDVSFDKEYLYLDNNKTELNRDKFDANTKLKKFIEESTNYFYFSPRVRHNSFGYYQNSLAMRTGLGKKFEPFVGFKVNLEMGTGYRTAWVATHERINEPLFTATMKLRWPITEGFLVQLDVVNEQSNREAYRTFEIKLQNKLTKAFAVQYMVNYSRAFPFDSFENGSETNAEVGVAYSF